MFFVHCYWVEAVAKVIDRKTTIVNNIVIVNKTIETEGRTPCQHSSRLSGQNLKKL